MPEQDIKIVMRIEDYYDEENEALTCNINDRKLCLKHDFINASLHFGKKVKDGKIFINFKSPKIGNFNPEWGRSIRFCKNCKYIDCIHIFMDNISRYRVNNGEFSHYEYSIGICVHCNKRILLSGHKVFEPSRESLKLISELSKEMGKMWDDHRYGSGFYCEFPVEVSRRLKYSTKDAEDYVKAILLSGDLSF